jgi:hypothetical protein
MCWGLGYLRRSLREPGSHRALGLLVAREATPITSERNGLGWKRPMMKTGDMAMMRAITAIETVET